MPRDTPYLEPGFCDHGLTTLCVASPRSTPGHLPHGRSALSSHYQGGASKYCTCSNNVHRAGNDDNTTNILSRGIGPREQGAQANETHVKNVATNPRVNDPKMDLKRMHINDDDMETNLDDIAPTALCAGDIREEFPSL